jgi:hypothetical protein
MGRKFITVGSTPLAVTILASEPGQGGFDAGSAGSAIYRLLTAANIGWTVGTVDVTGQHDLETEKMSLLENLNEVQKIWGGWLVFDSINKTVSLRDDQIWQNDTGFELRYRKNQKTLTKIEDKTNIVTRLIPFGEKDLVISSVNGGVYYLENFSYTNEIREGIWRREDIDDPQELKTAAIDYLSKVCRPRVQYRATALDLKSLPDYKHETFSLGDIITIQDEELADAVKVRLIGYSYDVLQPWKCDLKIGEPLVVDPQKELAASLKIADFVQTVLLPSKGVSTLTKGIINTFTTIINSSNGKVLWSDDTLTFIEIDEEGAETGKRMKLTPGGLGISTDSGASYVTAITGEGIAGNTIIVTDAYAISTEDTYSKMNSTGFHVYDDEDTERVLVGKWMDGETSHFGVKIYNDKGDVLIDDTGILQTWQEGRTDNVDSSKGLEVNCFLPDTTIEVVNANLRIKLAKFRAYETGAASGGGSTSGASSASTTPSGGGSTSGSSSASTTASGGGATSSESGEHRHKMFSYSGGSSSTQDRLYVAADSSGIGTSVYMNTYGTGDLYTRDAAPNHTHTVGNHTHGMSHTHTTPNHSHNIEHTHTIPNHTHNLTFGIYEGTAATGVTVTINGVDRTAALGGPFNADQSGLDIAQYLVVGQWNTILLGSTQLGRIDATVFLQAKMSATA